jgi:hypothetical protein
LLVLLIVRTFAPAQRIALRGAGHRRRIRNRS